MNYRSVWLFVFASIFFISGFSGLIYESIWSHYLKLFLGHASYAQVLVLVIFMGGMAIGAALASKFSIKLTNLILWYGIAEFLIGLSGVTFHQTFVAVQAVMFEQVFTYLQEPWLVHSAKWIVGSILILPQSILLGATFPLLTAGVIRRFSDENVQGDTGVTGKGKIIATFYFVNSLGASIGILCNTFFLIPSIGLPGATMVAGLINIAIALVVYVLTKKDHFPAVKKQDDVSIEKESSLSTILLVVATLTGLASFMYEIGWIRMLTMVLGASTHSFEIMLSAFIFGLALGGYWIRNRIDKFNNPIVVLALIQLIMGALAALTIPLYNQSYELMGFAINVLNKNDGGYLLYTYFSYFISLLIMLPVAFCAGTTLPLVTTILLKNRSGDAVIGKVYAFNTIGSIVGVLLAVHIVMPVFGLKWVILGGASVDLLLGIYLLYHTRYSFEQNRIQSLAIYLCVLVFLLFPALGLDTQKMASSVFRSGLQGYDSKNVIFHKDGKASTVALVEQSNSHLLLNNGKPDASIVVGSPDKFTDDEPTMVMLGALPYVYSPEAKNIANIGLGSGLTAHTLLHDSHLQRLDTIEIEQAMYEAAEYFRPNVENIFTDKRSNIILEDAKTYFAASGNIYDVIVSEPPNPWVSGVAGLFSTEFYQEIKRYLHDDGIFVQWIHLYEISPELVATVYHALRENFSDIHFYQISSHDIAIVAANTTLKADYNRVFIEPSLKQELARIEVNNPRDIAARKVAGNKKLDVIFNVLGKEVNSDYYPILDNGAAKTRFLKIQAIELLELVWSTVIDRITNEPHYEYGDITPASSISFIKNMNEITAFYELFLHYTASGKRPFVTKSKSEILASALFDTLQQCNTEIDEVSKNALSIDLFKIIDWFSSYLQEDKQKVVLNHVKKCEKLFNKHGKLWVDANLAWLNNDLETLFELTDKYLQEVKFFNGEYHKELLMFNLATRNILNIEDNRQIKAYVSKMPANMWNDLELKALLYMFEPDLVK